MADQIPNPGLVQENGNESHSDVDIAESETVQEEVDLVNIERRLPETLLWCLACHQMGHRAQNCTEAPPNVPEVDAWDLLSRVRLDPIPTDDEWPDLRKLINLLSVFEVENSEFSQHIDHRDALLAAIYDEMTNWHAPLFHETWFHFMSMFHKIVYQHKDRLQNTLSRILRSPLGDCALSTENALTFLCRAREDLVGLPWVEMAVEAFKADLESTKDSFWEQFSTFVADLEVYLAGSPEILTLDPADSAWMCKAFWVMVDVQPTLHENDVYIVRWSYQNIDDVVATEGLEI